MSEMTDRVARAIYHGTPRNKPWEQLQPVFKAYWHKRARAAIEAMREPTEPMLEAAWQSVRMAKPDARMAALIATPRDGHIYKMLNRWRAMIDAALSQ